jgi:hypothetical protein
MLFLGHEFRLSLESIRKENQAKDCDTQWSNYFSHFPPLYRRFIKINIMKNAALSSIFFVKNDWLIQKINELIQKIRQFVEENV